MKKIAMTLAATLLATAAATSADAALITYNINGVLSDGKTVDGSFTLDTAKSEFDQYSNVNVGVTGLPAFTSLNGLGYSGYDQTGPFSIYLGTSGYQLTVTATGTHNGFTLNSIGGNLDLMRSNLYNSSTRVSTYFKSGSISQINAAVPEPATWAMMILGAGAVGFAMRRSRKSKVSTTVSFA